MVLFDDHGNPEDGSELFEETPKYIISITWENGIVAVAYYDLTTAELSVTYETADLRPNFSFTHNIFRQIVATKVLVSGPEIFLRAIMSIIGLRSDDDLRKYRVRPRNIMQRSNSDFFIYSSIRPNLRKNLQRILDIQIPNMRPGMTESERHMFLGTFLPLGQDRVVHSLGNLLCYLDMFWHQLHNESAPTPIITNVNIFHLESHVLMDDDTLFALDIFSRKEPHPSSYKQSSFRINRENESLYGIMNRCSSALSKKHLRVMLQQPIRDLDEIHKRHMTIDWLNNPIHQYDIARIRPIMSHVMDINAVYTRLATRSGKPKDWQSIIRTMNSLNLISRICLQLQQKDVQQIPGQSNYLTNIADTYINCSELNSILQLTLETIDVETSLKENRFCINSGLCGEVDQMKDEMLDCHETLWKSIKTIFSEIPQIHQMADMLFVREYGFVIRIDYGEEFFNESLILDLADLHFIIRYGSICYYKTAKFEEINDYYKTLYPKVCAREREISESLIAEIYSNLHKFQMLTNQCIKLDCLMAMAAVAKELKLCKPILTAGKQCIEIVGGRHLLVESISKINTSGNRGRFQSNDTRIGCESGNLMTILCAPNSSGKSVYLKQVALIVYLSHIGSYVPAKYAKISQFRSIFTRMYTAESVYMGNSSFLKELQEMARILNISCSDSLIIIDEFGKGTTVIEGKALLASCLNYLAERGSVAPITLIATHYSDISNFIRNKSFVAMQTIDTYVTQSKTSNDLNGIGALASTYKIVNGVNRSNYGYQCAPVLRFLQRLKANQVPVIIENKFRNQIECAIDMIQQFYPLTPHIEN